MNLNHVDLLLIEDNTSDAELTIRELKKHNLANNLFHVKDGEEALEFVFATGKYKGTRTLEHPPKIILLDIQMPKVNGIEVLQKCRPEARLFPLERIAHGGRSLCISIGGQNNPAIEQGFSVP